MVSFGSRRDRKRPGLSGVRRKPRSPHEPSVCQLCISSHPIRTEVGDVVTGDVVTGAPVTLVRDAGTWGRGHLSPPLAPSANFLQFRRSIIVVAKRGLIIGKGSAVTN